MTSRPEDKSATCGEPNEKCTPTSFLIRTLIGIAERRSGIDSISCRLAQLHFETATLLHRSLYGALQRHGLTDVQFAVLVVLFSTEPDPIAVSVLAEHAGVSASASADALEKLEVIKLVQRIRDHGHRPSSYARITDEGQDAVDAALRDYLQVAEAIASHIRPSTQRRMLSGYIDLLRGLAGGGLPATHG